MSAADLTAIKRKIGKPDWFADVTGDGRVTLADYNLARTHLGERLP